MREVRAITRAVQVIETLVRSGASVRINELCRSTGIPRVTCYEIVSTLSSCGLVRVDRRGGVELGSRLLAWGGAYAQGTDLGREARAVARRLSDELGETVHVAVLDGADALYVAKAEGRNLIRVSTGIGTRMPAHATGVGKVLLANLPRAQRAKILSEAPLIRLTPMTIVDLDALEEHLDLVAVDGIAIDRQESTLEVGCVAAPIHNHEGEVVAAISIAMLVNRLDSTVHGPAVREAAAELSARLGWRGH